MRIKKRNCTNEIAGYDENLKKLNKPNFPKLFLKVDGKNAILPHPTVLPPRIMDPLNDFNRLTNDDELKNIVQDDSTNLTDESSKTESKVENKYVKNITMKEKELEIAWSKNDSVLSLRMIIQLLKHLSTSKAIKFFPYKFILITDVLDKFRDLLFERIELKRDINFQFSKDKLNYEKMQENFLLDNATRFVVDNWFEKIRVIRELVPRTYLEAATFHLLIYSNDKKLLKFSFNRLMNMCRGISDPIASIYCRCYIMKQILELKVWDVVVENGFLEKYLSDIFILLESLNKNRLSLCRHLIQLEDQSIDSKNEKIATEKDFVSFDWYSNYIQLFHLPLQLLCDFISIRMRVNPEMISDEKSLEYFSLLPQSSSLFYGIILYHILPILSYEWLICNSPLIVEEISSLDVKTIKIYQLLLKFGEMLVDEKLNNSNSSMKITLKILNRIWKLIRRLENIDNYLENCSMWIQVTLFYFQKNQVNALIGDIIKTLATKKFEEIEEQSITDIKLKYYQQIIRNICNLWKKKGNINYHPMNYDKLIPLIQSINFEHHSSILATELLQYSTKFQFVEENIKIEIDYLLKLNYFNHFYSTDINDPNIFETKTKSEILIQTVLYRIPYLKDVKDQVEYIRIVSTNFPMLEEIHLDLCKLSLDIILSVDPTPEGQYTSDIYLLITIIVLHFHQVKENYEKLQLIIKLIFLELKKNDKISSITLKYFDECLNGQLENLTDDQISTIAQQLSSLSFKSYQLISPLSTDIYKEIWIKEKSKKSFLKEIFNNFNYYPLLHILSTSMKNRLNDKIILEIINMIITVLQRTSVTNKKFIEHNIKLITWYWNLLDKNGELALGFLDQNFTKYIEEAIALDIEIDINQNE
ncbi:hypothetical protein SNEBB_005357 [Seison nebaliae]|nr:hypothetical protein SNEBB_005357 [Seison nebaliae]